MQEVSAAPRGRGTRERILSVATEMFSQRGYEACPVAEIVARAGVTKPVLYYYFGSKEGLFRAILEEARRCQEELLEEALSDNGPMAPRILRLLREVYQEVMERPHLFRLLHHLAFSSPSHVPPGFDLESFPRRMTETLASMALEGMDKGELLRSDPGDVALLLLGILSLCIDMDQCYPHNADPERLERLLRLALGGLGCSRG
jgi:TetR/AcrR family transcriptional regulator